MTDNTKLFSPGFFGRFFNRSPNWELHLSAPTSTLVFDGQKTAIDLQAILSARVEDGYVWSMIAIGPWRLEGLTIDRRVELGKTAQYLAEQLRRQQENEARRKEAEELARLKLEEEERRIKAEIARLRAEFEKLVPSLDRLSAAYNELLGRGWYIREYLRNDFLSKCQGDIEVLPALATVLDHPLFQHEKKAAAHAAHRRLARALTSPFAGIKDYNDQFINAEKVQWADFFKNVEKSELTDEQQIASIVHEDRNLLVAAAGSGKSSTLVAKVGYAIKKGYIKPEQVLALAFNNDAAKELSERLDKRLKLPIKAQTFHSLGNEIIKNTLGRRSLLTNNSSELQKLLDTLLIDSPGYRTLFYLYHAAFCITEPEQEHTSVQAYETYIRRVGEFDKDRKIWGVPTLRGGVVRSFEELSIANWLHVQGIEYRYESFYPHDVTHLGWTKYEPDFCYVLPDGRTIYHEHFALRPDGTSPFGQSYVESAKQKRALHKKYGTLCFETTSAGFKNGRIFTDLQAALDAHGIPFAPMTHEAIADTLKGNPLKEFTKLAGALIAHAKEGGLTEESIRQRAQKLRNQLRTQSFLALFFPLWEKYEEYLKRTRKIDFADMIGEAAALASRKEFPSPYKFILVDEFQDISRGRANLVRALLDLHPDSVLFGVGDDWQSINGFAGSDLSIMRQFETEFGRSATNYLSLTFRSNQGISNVAAMFVSENGTQIKKSVKSIQPKTKDVVRLTEFNGLDDQRKKIASKLGELAEKASIENRVISVMLLGRYKYTTTEAITDEQVKEWNLTFAGRLKIIRKEKKKDGEIVDAALDTVHSSKGLESDFVLVHSLQAPFQGFPCNIEDDPLLTLVLPDREPFSYAEDRRLFYVALTRAKEEVTLFVSRGQASPFAIELLGKKYRGMVTFEGLLNPPEICTTCGQGYYVPRPGKRGPFLGCSSFPTTKCNGSKDMPLTMVA
ncbi:UvrD-helicase domain-containing protein [Undibacterium sp. Rencai35W]|uniref:UvrD-helicase domain-containing protein n=1 Tax=Undibacterium sp. Rencai35W TaxID=3413046 RepID=UPI003BF2A124